MKKYNLSEIMKNMHGLIKAYNMNKSEALRKAWAEAKAVAVDSIDTAADEFVALKNQMAALKEQMDALEEKIIERLDGREEFKTDRYTIRYKTVIRNILDTNRLKTDNKELYEMYLKANESKRFTVTA